MLKLFFFYSKNEKHEILFHCGLQKSIILERLRKSLVVLDCVEVAIDIGSIIKEVSQAETGVSLDGVIAKVLDYGLKVNEFKLQSYYYVSFLTNIPQLWVK